MSMALSSSSRAANQGSSSSINSMNNQGHNNYYPHPHNSYHPTRRGPRPSQFIVELSQCLLDFVVQLLPSENEVAVKDDVRKLLERLIKTIEPSAQLLSFGSTANGFELKNSDMDLCCLIDNKPDGSVSRQNRTSMASQFVLRAAQLLERETKFSVTPLPNARIPIIKLSLQASPSIPFGIACDIGFENRLALENTRLLYTYAAIDPTRVRTLVLFLKLWSKRRKINSPYHGTLSSYGYAMLVIFFLVHVKDPPVLPNLQQMPPMRPISPEDMHIDGRNVWFFDDVDLLRRKWQSSNVETIGDLLLDFFRYFSREFNYATTVISIRSGLLPKETVENKPPDPRNNTFLCIEDPFETDFNVGRCVTRDGLYTIRGEFMRALRILSVKHEIAMVSLAQLCDEREEMVPRSANHRTYNHRYYDGAPRAHSAGTSPVMNRVGLSFSPSHTNTSQESLSSYSNSIGNQNNSNSTSPVVASPLQDETVPPLPPPALPTMPTPALLPPTMVPLAHMAPQRGKWTSPPPDHAPPQRQSSFEERLASGIKLAITHPPAERVPFRVRSSPSSSTATDEDGEGQGDDTFDASNFPTQELPSPSPMSSNGLKNGNGNTSLNGGPSRGRPPIRIQGSESEDGHGFSGSSSTPRGWRPPFYHPNSPHNNSQYGFHPGSAPSQGMPSLPAIAIPPTLPYFMPAHFNPSQHHLSNTAHTRPGDGAPRHRNNVQNKGGLSPTHVQGAYGRRASLSHPTAPITGIPNDHRNNSSLLMPIPTAAVQVSEGNTNSTR